MPAVQTASTPTSTASGLCVAAGEDNHDHGHRETLDFAVDNKAVATSSAITDTDANHGHRSRPRHSHPHLQASTTAKNNSFSSLAAPQPSITPSCPSSHKQQAVQLPPDATNDAADASSASSPLSECSSIPGDHADPCEIEKLWQAVYEHKQKIESAVVFTMPPSTSPTTPSSIGEIAIVDTYLYPREPCATAHFGTRLTNTAGLIVKEQDTSQILAIYDELRGQRDCETLPELKHAVETYLAPRHSRRDSPGHVPSSPPNCSAPDSKAPMWVFRRFLQPDITCNNKNNKSVRAAAAGAGGGWQSIKPRLEHQRAAASITFWLARLPATEDLTMLLEETTYVIGPDNAICPYLSIEFQASNEDETAAAGRLARMGGDALYNRFRLREKLVQISQRERRGKTEEAEDSMARDWDKVRHYGVVIGWDTFSVWVIEPNRPRCYKPAQEEQDSAVNMTTTPAPSSGAGPVPPPSLRALSDRGDRAPSTPSLAQTAQTGSTNNNKASVAKNTKPRTTKAAALIELPADDRDVAGAGLTPPPPVSTSTQWRGGRMRQLFGTRYRAASVSMLAQWINTIHHWAATDFAGALEADISAVLRPAFTTGSGDTRHAAGDDGVVLECEMVVHEETIGSQEQAIWRKGA